MDLQISLTIALLIYISLVLLFFRLRPYLGKKRKTRMIVYRELCNGCGNCVVACPSNALSSVEAGWGKGPGREKVVVMNVQDGIALELDMSLCRRTTHRDEEPPCRVCIDACPLDALDFTY